jgi:AcrR family transcriptional regulator
MIKGRSKVNTEIRREQITQAAFNIIASHGVKGLTTSAIAKNVGVSEANLYRHFENKKEILTLAVDRIGEGLLLNLEAVRRTTPSKPLLKLKKLFVLHLEYIEKNEGIPRLLFSEEMHMGNNELRGKLLNAINTYTKGMELLIKEGQRSGTINKKMDCHALALTIIGMIQITTMKWSLNGFSFSLVGQGMKLWKNFERCIAEK